MALNYLDKNVTNKVIWSILAKGLNNFKISDVWARHTSSPNIIERIKTDRSAFFVFSSIRFSLFSAILCPFSFGALTSQKKQRFSVGNKSIVIENYISLEVCSSKQLNIGKLVSENFEFRIVSIYNYTFKSVMSCDILHQIEMNLNELEIIIVIMFIPRL